MDLNLIFFFSAWLIALTEAIPPMRSAHSLQAAIRKIAGDDFIINVPNELFHSSARATGKIGKQSVDKPVEGMEDNLANDELVNDEADQLDDDMNFDGPLLFNNDRGMRFRWPGGIVPLDISTEFSPETMEKILEAIRTYEMFTCIRFVQRDPSMHADYVRIESVGANICQSAVGYTSAGRQMIHLNEWGCFAEPGVILHELMHTLGFPHEHSRPDRDSHVSIKWKNIQPGQEHNFAVWWGMQSYDVGYDFGSLMHYRPKSFTKNGHRTIVPHHWWHKYQMGQRQGFSMGDVKKIRGMYKCHLSVEERNELYFAEMRGIQFYKCRTWGQFCEF